MAIYSLALHGGAGTISKDEMKPEQEAAYLFGLEEALHAGYKVLENGGDAIDAVTSAVTTLENNILFNAGKGSVFTSEGQHEMDAAIMEGATLRAGAIAGVRNVRNPIVLAAAVMQKSNHVFLSGEGAMEFARQNGIAFENDEYFFSQFRFNQWEAIQGSEQYQLDHSIDKRKITASEKKFGTVGAVARDIQGNLAAATSTGGMTNKKFGRIGDSPLVGAGTYANNQTCAISCTGHGEPFIRAVAAYDVSCLMEYKGLCLHDAMHIVVNEKLIALDGEGGMIGVDSGGNIAMLFNCPGMYRAMQNNDGVRELAIYRS